MVIFTAYSSNKIKDTFNINSVDKLLINGKLYGLTFNKDKNGGFSMDMLSSGITNMILYADIYSLSYPHHETILMIFNYLKYKSILESLSPNISAFQLNVESSAFRPIAGGGKCTDVPDCKEESKLPCVATESPGDLPLIRVVD